MSAWEQHLQRAAAVRERRDLVRRPRALPRGAVDLAGNDYLGLARHPRVLAGAREALELHGAGATASRLVTGTTAVHTALEEALADWCGAEAALVFSSGYLANLGVVTALADRGTTLVATDRMHASVHDAVRLARGQEQVVAHDDPVALEAVLAASRSPRALVLVESVDSVTGAVAPLAELAAVCARHGALLVVGEAHGLGVLGGGRGLVAHAGLAGRPDVVQVVTLSKALGAQGGAVLGPAAVVRHVAATARAFIYDTALAPAPAGAALSALGVLADEPERVERLHRVRDRLAGALGVEAPPGAVMARPAPDAATALAWQAACQEQGVAVGCFRPPSVPDGVSRLRVTASAGLDDAALERGTAVLESVLGPVPESALERALPEAGA